MPYISCPGEVPLDDNITVYFIKDLVPRDVEAAAQEILVQT
jgi:hypothetical protein